MQSKKVVGPDQKPALVRHMTEEYDVSVRQGYKAVWMARSAYRYEPKPKTDEEMIDALNALVTQYPLIDFWQGYHRLRLAGHRWNHRRVCRVYMALGYRMPSDLLLPTTTSTLDRAEKTGS